MTSDALRPGRRATPVTATPLGATASPATAPGVPSGVPASDRPQEPANDIEIAGDPLALPHLRPPAPTGPRTVADLAALVDTLGADRATWAPLVRYDPTSRWYHRLAATPTHELWLLSWLPGQGTGRHDHGRSLGVFTVLRGCLTERVAAAAPRRLRSGTLRVLPPGHVHEVTNDSLEPAVSLHLYAPGLTEMTVHPAPAAEHLPAGTHLAD